MGFELVGRQWSKWDFAEYIHSVDLNWCDSVTVHHTSAPSLAQRPDGWTMQHMRNLEDFYKNKLGWSSGPHLFTDEDQIWGISSLYRRGVHARSFNRRSIGIETLGDYDTEDPASGRGLACFEMTAHAVAVLLRKIGQPITGHTVKFHREDPRTSKTCPGKRVSKGWFLELVRIADAELSGAPNDKPLTLDERITRIEKHLQIT